MFVMSKSLKHNCKNIAEKIVKETYDKHKKGERNIDDKISAM